MQQTLQTVSNERFRRSAWLLPLLLVFVLVPEAAFAMPWDGPLQQFQANLTGPVAQAIAAIVFVVAGLLIAFGEVHGILGTVLRIALGLSFALMAVQWVGIFGGGGSWT